MVVFIIFVIAVTDLGHCQIMNYFPFLSWKLASFPKENISTSTTGIGGQAKDVPSKLDKHMVNLILYQADYTIYTDG